MTTADVNSIYGLYVTYYGRAADRDGLNFWVDQGVNKKVSLESIATGFAGAQESKTKYPYLASPTTSDPTAFVTSIYKNSFGRDPEAGGLAFWVNELKTKGSAQAPTFILTVLLNAQGIDKTALQNKATIAKRFTDGLNSGDISVTTTTFTDSTTILNTITDAASLTAGNTTVDAKIASYTGITTPLTTSVNDNLIGTANNDRFVGTNNGTTATDQVQATDKIDGGAGIDTFQYTGAYGIAAVPTLLNVEKVELLSPASGSTIDFTGKATGLQQVTIKGPSLAAFTAKGLSGIALGVEGSAVTAGGTPTTTIGTLTADFGSATSATLSIKDAVVTKADLSINTTLTTLNIVADGLGKNSISFDGAGNETNLPKNTTTLNISGAGTINLGTLTATIVDASQKNTGGVTVSAFSSLNGSPNVPITITGGGGDDFLTANGSTTTLNGGAGNDTLIGSSQTTNTFYGGAGRDILTGKFIGTNSVSDRYVYKALTDSSAANFTGSNSEVTFDDITNFVAASDKIDISGIAGYTSAKWVGDVTSTFGANTSFGNGVFNLTAAGGKLAASGTTGYFRFGTTTYVFGSDGIANTTAGVGGDLLIALINNSQTLGMSNFIFASA